MSSPNKVVHPSTKYRGVGLDNDASTPPPVPFDSENTFERYSASEQVQGKRRDIAWSACLLTVPMLVLTCALFAFVFGFRVELEDAPFPSLRGNESALGDKSTYYVALNSTFLIFLSSWMSSLAPMVAGFAVALAAYRVAETMLDDTVQNRRERLLTPFQLSLALRFLSGSTWSGIWNWATYKFGWRKQVPRQGVALTSLLRITLLTMFICFLVFVADTWLHVVTKTVSLVQLREVPGTVVDYSLSLLSPNCTTTNNTISQLAAAGLSCTMDPGTAKLQSGNQAIQTLNNQTNTLSVYNDGLDHTVAYLTVSQSSRNATHDFTASTFGIRTKCRPLTRSCGLGGIADASDDFAFNCSSGAFSGSVGSNFLNTQRYFVTDDMLETAEAGAANPFHYGIGALTQFTANAATAVADDPEVVIYGGGEALGIILFCTATAYDIEYDLVEEKVTRMTMTPSNTSVVNVFVPALSQSFFGLPNLAAALQIAAVVADDAQGIADQFAIAYSKVVLSIGAGSMIRSPTKAAQSRDTLLVAKVPKAPLFLLVIVNLIYVVLGVVLGSVALRTSQDAYEVKDRLSITGITYFLFEDNTGRHSASTIERLFREHWDSDRSNRIAIERSSAGGYSFTTLKQAQTETQPVQYHSTFR